MSALRTRRTRHRKVVVALGFAVTMVAPLTAGASGTAGSGVTGTYVGGIGLSGEYAPRLSEIGADAGAQVPIEGIIELTVDIAGPVEIVLTDGSMDGSWTMSGTGTISGVFGADDVAMSMGGNYEYDGLGTLSGTPGNYSIIGDMTSSGTVSIDVPLIDPLTSSDSSSSPIAEPITQLSIACDQISGRWDAQINQGLEDVKFDSDLRGYFTAVTTSDDVQDAIIDLTSSINQWAGQSADGYDSVDRWMMAFTILEIAQELIADLDAAGGCISACTFTTPLQHAATDVALDVIAEQPGNTTSYMVSLLLGAGSLGGCDPALTARVQDALNADLNLRIEALLAPGADAAPDWFANVADAARAAQMLGISTFGSSGLSPADVLMTLGDS